MGQSEGMNVHKMCLRNNNQHTGNLNHANSQNGH